MAWKYQLQHGLSGEQIVSFKIPGKTFKDKITIEGVEILNDIYPPDVDVSVPVTVGGRISDHVVPLECQASTTDEAMVWVRYHASVLGATIVEGSVVEAA